MGATLTVRGSFLSHRRALEHHRLIEPISGPVHLVNPRRARPQPGLIVHEAVIPSSWATLKDRIPTVVPMLAIAQCAGTLGPTALRKVLEQAEYKRVLDIPLLDEILEAHPNLKGRARLLDSIEPFRATIAAAETRSPLEIRFLRECRRRPQLPMPATNVPIDRYEVDFYWPDARLIVETDGYEAHGTTRHAFNRDREKWARLTALGYPLIIVTDDRLSHDADALFAEILTVLNRAVAA